VCMCQTRPTRNNASENKGSLGQDEKKVPSEERAKLPSEVQAFLFSKKKKERERKKTTREYVMNVKKTEDKCSREFVRVAKQNKYSEQQTAHSWIGRQTTKQHTLGL